MGKPCAVFWDIENIGVPKGQSVDSIVNQIRSTIIKPHNLNEIFFFCVCDVQKLSPNIGQSLTKLDADIVQTYNGVKISADIKILDLMRKFVAAAGHDCTIILLSGDADSYGALSDLKKIHNISIHLIRLANSFSPKLDQISDYTFMLDNGVLKPVKSTGSSMYFISIKNYPLTMDINQVMNGLNAQANGSIENSAILYDSLICIGFTTLWNAERAIEQLNGSRYHGHFLKVELILDSPLTEILKCIKPKVKKFNLDAIISEPPIDLTIKSDENPYTVESCEQIVPNEISSDSGADYSSIATIKPESAMQANKQEPSSSIAYVYGICLSADIEPKASKKTVSTSVELQNIINLDVCADNGWKIFFRCPYGPAFLMFYYGPNIWSLLYNLFEKLYDLGAKKVIFDEFLFCAHFDSASAYQKALSEKRSHYLEHLEVVNSR